MADLSKLAPEELVELSRLWQKIEQITPEELAEAVQAEALPPIEQLAEDLKNAKAVTRKVKGAGRPKAKKQHWKTTARKRKEYYQSTVKYKRLIKKGELLSTGPEGWWEHIRGHWYQKGYEVHLTKQEWIDIVWPTLGGKVPVIRRYVTAEPISLENIYVVESGTQNNVLFDGKEWRLRKDGYIL